MSNHPHFYKRNVFSQYGEDGIIEYLLKRYVPNRAKFMIEFGAADGVFMSNTAYHWLQLKDTDALLIESDDESFAKLQQRARGFRNVEIQHAFVTNIDDHTSREADLCVIDVDGPDYQIAQKMQVAHRIVCIEHNPTVPPHVDMIHYEGTMFGSSAKSINNLMTGKGYTLCAATKTNLIYVRNDLYKIGGPTHTTVLEDLFDYSALNYLVTAYDGEWDTIGEFGYGWTRPTNLRLTGRPEEVSKTADAESTERMRIATHLQTIKDAEIRRRKKR